MGEWVWGVALGGGILPPLLWALWTWRRQKRWQRQVYDHACPVCETPFDEVMPLYLGPMSATDRARLDRFQRRFAGPRVRCEACGSIVLCSNEGFPMRGYQPQLSHDRGR